MGNWKVLRCGAVVLGLGFSGGSGCQQFGPASWNNPVLLTGKETNARVGNKETADVQVALGRSSEPAKERIPELKAIVGKLRGDNQPLDTTKTPKSAVVSQPVLPQFHALPTEVAETEVPKVPVAKPVLPESHTLATELPESKVQVAKVKLDFQPADSSDKTEQPGPQIINLREFQTVTAKEPSNAVAPEEKPTSKISVALTFFRLRSQEP